MKIIILVMNKNAFLSVLNSLKCDFALYYRPNGGEPLLAATAERFPSASVIKVPVLLAWIALEKQGLVNRAELCSLDDEPPVQGSGFSWLLRARRLPFQDILLLMMTVSDNLCTNLVIRRIGLERLNDLFRSELGLQGTELQRKMMDFEARARGCENWITVQDAVRLYGLLDRLGPADRAWVHSLLLANQDHSLLMREIPRDSLDFYHKEGALPGQRTVLNDWGFTSDCQVFLFADRIPSETEANRVFAEIGRLALLPSLQ